MAQPRPCANLTTKSQDNNEPCSDHTNQHCVCCPRNAQGTARPALAPLIFVRWGGTRTKMISVLTRARLSSFLAGAAVAGGVCMLQLRGDVLESYKVLKTQASVRGVSHHQSGVCVFAALTPTPKAHQEEEEHATPRLTACFTAANLVWLGAHLARCAASGPGALAAQLLRASQQRTCGHRECLKRPPQTPLCACLFRLCRASARRSAWPR